MNNPAGGEPVKPEAAAPSPAPHPADAAAAAKKPGSTPLVILVGLLGAGFALAVVFMSRSVAPPQTTAAAAPAPKKADAPARAVPAVEPTRWAPGTRWISDRKSVAFELKSSNRVSVWMGQVQPSLVVRCVADHTEAFVYTETAARIEPGAEDRAVRVRFDNEPYVDERWPDSEEHKGLFAPNPETFAQRLMHAGTFDFQFTPHNAEAAEVHFNVAGLRELLEPVGRKCGWK